MARVESVQV
jgi:hypothetical protein